MLSATFLLGRSSETDDTEADVTVCADASMPTRMEIDRAMPRFIGSIPQRPPAHSAIKVQGQRAYKLARQGVAVALAPRFVEIHSLRVMCYDYPALEVDIECGSGTYIRALGRDLAAELGTSAVMSALVRTAVGSFCVEDAATLDELTAETIEEYLQPPFTAVAEMPQVTLDESQLIDLRHGRPITNPASGISCSPATTPPEWAALTPTGQLAAILREKRAGQLWPHRNFHVAVHVSDIQTLMRMRFVSTVSILSVDSRVVLPRWAHLRVEAAGPPHCDGDTSGSRRVRPDTAFANVGGRRGQRPKLNDV